MRRTYEELRRIESFEDRYAYLRVHSTVGLATFGFERWLNQAFYSSIEWKRARQEVIARDLGCDLGIEGHEVFRTIYVHHMNPIDPRNLRGHDPEIIDPNFLISVSLRTHNAIHFGTASQLDKPLARRRPGDTKLW